MSQSKQLSSEHLPYDVVFDILTRLPVKSHSPTQNLCIDVCNSDRTLTHISTFQLPFSALMVGFCNGLFCLRNMDNKVLYLWNPSIRKFKMISTPIDPFVPVAIGLAYHSQNNDFKILKMSCFLESNTPHAEVYTLSTDSWRRVVISLGSIDFLSSSFCNGALHFIASSESRQFILSFDFNDERFREIMLPQNYDDDILELPIYRLAVFKGSLAFFVCDFGVDLVSDICYIWVMREYGVVESWTKISRTLVSYDPVSLNENNLGIQSPRWVSYTADLMENLVLLNQECYSLIGFMKNWISSRSQSSFAHQNKLSHEIDLLGGKSSKCQVRTLEAGGSSNPVPDAAGGITPPANEGNPMNTTVQSKEGSSRRVKRLAPELPSHPPVRGSTTLATLRSKIRTSSDSGEQITCKKLEFKSAATLNLSVHQE
uniref:F-box associated beta-propeller type 1 domain-containing protein n=1 Tax=Fagus sylvatica TaxID=28930 RepID=A0A2N9FES2_FAGSY